MLRLSAFGTAPWSAASFVRSAALCHTAGAVFTNVRRAHQAGRTIGAGRCCVARAMR